MNCFDRPRSSEGVLAASVLTCRSWLIKLIKMIILIKKDKILDTLNASDAKREFGDALIKAQHGPVRINKNGKPVAVLISANEFTQLQAYRERCLQQEIAEGIADLDAGRVIDGDKVIAELRARLSNAKG